VSGPPSIGHEIYGGAVLLTVVCAGVGELLARLIGMPTSTGLWLGGIVGAAISYQQIQKAKQAAYKAWEAEIRKSERRRGHLKVVRVAPEPVPIASELAPDTTPTHATDVDTPDKTTEAPTRTIGVIERRAVMAQLKRLRDHHGAFKIESKPTLVTVDPARSLLFIGPGEGASFETAELRARGAGPGATWLTSVGELYRHLFPVNGEYVVFGEAADGSLAITEVEPTAVEELLNCATPVPAS
jgi:hypothetical protein